jgi:hypothetical protein
MGKMTRKIDTAIALTGDRTDPKMLSKLYWFIGIVFREVTLDFFALFLNCN